tara:strand:+ start:362 stop:1135 length:774 start_codon:yes stop_codon:yes gene_type:complete
MSLKEAHVKPKKYFPIVALTFKFLYVKTGTYMKVSKIVDKNSKDVLTTHLSDYCTIHLVKADSSVPDSKQRGLIYGGRTLAKDLEAGRMVTMQHLLPNVNFPNTHPEWLLANNRDIHRMKDRTQDTPHVRVQDRTEEQITESKTSLRDSIVDLHKRLDKSNRLASQNDELRRLACVDYNELVRDHETLVEEYETQAIESANMSRSLISARDKYEEVKESNKDFLQEIESLRTELASEQDKVRSLKHSIVMSNFTRLP